MATKKNTGLRQVTPGRLAQLIAKEQAYTDHVMANPIVYPDPNPETLKTLAMLGTEGLAPLGFAGHELHDLLDVDAVGYRGNRRHRGGRRGNRGGNRGNQGGNQNQGGGNQGGGNNGGGRGRSLPNPQVVLGVVKALIAKSGARPVDNQGPIVWAEQNFEFLDITKSNYFMDSYKEMIPLAHIWLCAEVAKDGLEEIARQTGYTAYVSVENNRHQAVGILLHPRLQIVGSPNSIDEVATVQGIPDLRPAFQVNVKDTTTGDTFWGCAVHLKSMRGGPAATGAVRHQQCAIMAKKLTGKGIVGGDMNTFLDSSSDIQPLIQAGFVLAHPGSTTQSMGGILDGFFQLSMPKNFGNVELLAWFKDPTIGRGLTDHGLLLASAV